MSERKTVFITGASRGIGHATAAYFVRRGWRAVTASRDEVPPECPRDERHEHITVDLELTRELQGRLAPLLARVDLSAIGDSWHLPADGNFLNSKWRINSYATGEAFLPHYDSGHDFGRGKRTLLSLIIYLNDDFTGGETTFFPADPTEEPLRIKPKTGSALLFHHYGPHSPLHGTAPLIATGRKKYIARTDVIYKDGGHTLERLLFQSPPPVQKAVVLFGVPGAGKSTQLELAAKRHGHAAVNFGRSVRALRGGSSELAQELCAYRAAKDTDLPLKWHDDQGRPVKMLDTRNGFEVDEGAFEGAIDWRLHKFSDFPAELDRHRDELQGATIVSYCTGGIRCEKAALLMRERGLANVYQLDGGILKYFEDTDSVAPGWRGRCFVFDERVALNPALEA